MIGNKRVIAIIPARGGSKRLPRKNILPFRGKPLIAWTIEAAQQSFYIDTLICSTDDAEISKVCFEYGCRVHKRPEHLATDTATSADVVLDALRSNGGYDLMVLLQPTSPLRMVLDIDCGISLGRAVSVSPTGAPNGAVYVADLPRFEKFPYFGGEVFYMPAERSADIDTLEDFERAQALNPTRFYADGSVGR